MSRRRTVLLAAVDEGARLALLPLGHVPPASSPVADTENFWTELIRKRRPPGLVCGTSDSPEGRAVEAAARRAAFAAGIPAVAIEDFPGNYCEVPGGKVALLVVESRAIADFTRSKLGSACPALATLSPARYDSNRRAAASLRAQVHARWSEPGRGRAILWAGQPETDDCLRTLELVLPHARRHDASLLFKAHPRDRGYGTGAYRELLADGARDVTALAVPEALALAPLLVVTQFSSVAIEAGFCGIPSLNVLLPEAGGRRLFEKKGYSVPPSCAAGAAALARDADEIARIFPPMLEDRAQRQNIVRCFDAYFETRTATLPALIATLERLFTATDISPLKSRFSRKIKG